MLLSNFFYSCTSKFFVTVGLVLALFMAANFADYLFVNHDLKSTVDICVGIFAGVICLAMALMFTGQIKARQRYDS